MTVWLVLNPLLIRRYMFKSHWMIISVSLHVHIWGYKWETVWNHSVMGLYMRDMYSPCAYMGQHVRDSMKASFSFGYGTIHEGYVSKPYSERPCVQASHHVYSLNLLSPHLSPIRANCDCLPPSPCFSLYSCRLHVREL